MVRREVEIRGPGLAIRHPVTQRTIKLGIRLPVVLITRYLLHGLWDVLHEIDAHHGAADIKRS
jgi:hypothetical protein